MADQLPQLISPQDIERIRNGDSRAAGDAIEAILKGLNTLIVSGIQSSIQAGTLAAAPTTLGVGDVGFEYLITDYDHRVRWDGSAWQWCPGDHHNAYVGLFAVAPGTGWQLCDGTVTDYLVVGGATLTTTAFTTPNMTGSPQYLKTGAAYNGALVVGATTGETADVGVSGGAGNMDLFSFGAGAGATNVIASISTFVHRHGAGTLVPDPAHSIWLPYWRR